MQSLNAREQLILKRLTGGSDNNILELSKELKVSTNTIRNDIKSLEEKGCVITIRAGVLPAYYPEVLQRMNTHVDVKMSIAQKAAELIADNDTVMFSCGTTCSLVGRFLYGKRNIHLITHSTLFLPYARTNPNLTVTLVGGNFLMQEDATVGINIVQELDNYYPRITIVGSDNFSLESGLTTGSAMVAGIIKKMLAQAQKKVLIVESRKFGKARAVKIVGIEEIDTLITDSDIKDTAVRQFEKRGIQVIIVDV